MFFAPKVLQCVRFVFANNQKDCRVVRDYEFDLYMGGQRDIYIDDTYYHIEKGAMIFKKPGQTITGDGNYNMYMLTVDFTKENETEHKEYYRNSNTPQQKIYNSELLNNMPNVFYPSHTEELVLLYEKISKSSPPNMADKQLIDSYITEFLLLLMSDAVKYKRRSSEKVKNQTLYVRKACNYINSNYEKELTVEKIADYISLNKNYFIRIFKEEMGTTPNQYIIESRLFFAKNLLIQSTQSIKDIGELCGFKTPSYFVKCFKLKYGKSPFVYREEYHKKMSGLTV